MPLDSSLRNSTALTPPRIISAREEEIVTTCLRGFSQKQTWRATFASQWEEIAELIDPNSRNTFYYGNFNWPGSKKTDRQVDASGMMASSRFAAIMDSLLTPRNMFWHGLEADDPYVMKDRDTKLYFEMVSRLLFKHRYAAHANFTSQNQSIYRSLGNYGTASMFIDAFDGTHYHGARGLRYRALPLGQTFFSENHQGIIDQMDRWYRMTARQCMQKWGPDRFPDILRSALERDSPTMWDFLHCVKPRDDYDPDRLDERGKPFASFHISIAGRCLMQEGGYNSFPVAATRYEQAPEEVYGRGPAGMVLPALKTLNAEKRVFLKQGHRAADPVLLTQDDGIVDFSMKPGALNKGGVNADGKLMVNVLPSGNIQINKEMMDEEKSLINDAFLVTLFQILTETPQMTATEVVERANEKGILLAPTVGRQQSEYIGPMIDRELDVLAQQRLLPPMPPRLREAGGSYGVVHTSPLSRMMKAQEAAGFMRTVESIKELVNVTQDHSLLDPFDFDMACQGIAETQAVPVSWMATDGQIAQKRKARAQQQATQAKIQAMPAQAAMLKARAQAQKDSGGAGPGQLPAEGGGPLAEQLA